MWRMTEDNGEEPSMTIATSPYDGISRSKEEDQSINGLLFSPAVKAGLDHYPDSITKITWSFSVQESLFRVNVGY